MVPRGSSRDADEFDLLASEGADPEPAAPKRRRRGRWSGAVPWLAGASALVLIGSLSASPLRLDNDRGEQTGLTDIDLSEPPEIAWTAGVAAGRLYQVGDALVTQDFDDTGLLDAFSADDGATLWSYRVEGSACHVQIGVACVENPGAPDATIVTIDVVTGRTERSPRPGTLAAIALDGGPIAIDASGVDDTQEQVIRLDETGREIWRTSADVLQSDGFPDPMITLIGTEVSFWADGRTVDTGTGEEIPYEESEAVQDGADTDVPLVIDDDTGGQVVFDYSADTIVAESRDSAEVLWPVPDSCYPQARLRGVVMLGCYAEADAPLVGVEGTTGEQLWRLPHVAWIVLASRDTVLAFDFDSGVFSSIDVMTGTVLWQTAVSGVQDAVVTADGVIVATGTDVVRLRWPDGSG